MTLPTTRARSAARRAQRGMSLIELMVVLAVIGLMMGMVAYGAGTSDAAEASRATNQLANTIRFGFNKARVDGVYYRLNINLADRSFALQRADDRMYMPARDRDGKLIEIDESREEEREERDRRAEETFNRSLQSKVLARDDKPTAAADSGSAEGEGGGFEEAGSDPLNPYAVGPKRVPRRKPPLFAAFDDEGNTLSMLQKPFKFPKALEIVSVRTADDIKPITEGEANLYFFPQGRTQMAHIQVRSSLGDEDSTYTIIVHPLTGRVVIKEGLVDLELPADARDVEDDTGRRMLRRVL